MSKRGQGLSTNAIILIILGIVVLAVLILGFTLGWQRIAPWISSSNVDSIVTQCEAACSLRSVYDFCSRERELKDSSLPDRKVEGSCHFFATKQDEEGNFIYADYGINDCPGLCS
jgi:hypothetical protein